MHNVQLRGRPQPEIQLSVLGCQGASAPNSLGADGSRSETSQIRRLQTLQSVRAMAMQLTNNRQHKIMSLVCPIQSAAATCIRTSPIILSDDSPDGAACS